MNRATFKTMAIEKFSALLNKMVEKTRTRELMLSSFSDGLETGLDFDREAADWAYAHGFLKPETKNTP